MKENTQRKDIKSKEVIKINELTAVISRGRMLGQQMANMVGIRVRKIQVVLGTFKKQCRDMCG